MKPGPQQGIDDGMLASAEIADDDIRVAASGVIRVGDDIVADVHAPLGQDSLQARVLTD